MITTVLASIEAPLNGTRYTQGDGQSALTYGVTALGEYISLRRGAQTTHVQQPKDDQAPYEGTSTGPDGAGGSVIRVAV